MKKPSIIGHYTNDIVYARLAPGVLDELKRINPTQPSTGRRKSTHHQWFTPDKGHPKLKEHLAAVIAIMKLSQNWNRFMGNPARVFQKENERIPLALDDWRTPLFCSRLLSTRTPFRDPALSGYLLNTTATFPAWGSSPGPVNRRGRLLFRRGVRNGPALVRRKSNTIKGGRT